MSFNPEFLSLGTLARILQEEEDEAETPKAKEDSQEVHYFISAFALLSSPSPFCKMVIFCILLMI